ncbi:MAG TPA: hypothetical protein VMT87_00415 [Vicinamibacteria bacterium]|nr:hypothetical protein [Vicinamibacteria bacterium]
MRTWIPWVALVLAVSFVTAPGVQPGAAAQEPKKYRSVEAEVVSADVEDMTLAVRVDGEEKTLAVSRLAKARLSEVKAGDKVVLSCKDVEGKDREVVSIRPAREAPSR